MKRDKRKKKMTKKSSATQLLWMLTRLQLFLPTDIKSSVPEPMGIFGANVNGNPSRSRCIFQQNRESSAAEKYEPPSLAEEYAVLKEYDTAYEKKWDPVTKKFNYACRPKNEPGYKAIKQGTGIAPACVS